LNYLKCDLLVFKVCCFSNWGNLCAAHYPEVRSGCVCLSMHNPSSPGSPFAFWFPLEAVGALPHLASNAEHWVR
jgi:hypothetical protein